jgi:hypothetical protein
VGAPDTGTQVAAGTDDSLTDPRIILFDKPVRPCIVANHCSNTEILVKVNTELNGTVSETFSAANGLGHFIIPPKSSGFTKYGGMRHFDVSLGGLIAVHSVSICTTHASDSLADVSIVGFNK